MFKKFKEKVIESQTSHRFQQITQSVSDKFQNLEKDENFFSLTEDDNAIGSPTSTQMEPGFSNISLSSTPHDRNQHRRTSTSSMASDTSFIPRYDSVSSIYHLQSDLDISASEMEDNVSTTSSQVGHLSKEQIYSAFQKSQMRYHKYRGRFTDLAKHYKNLEREFSKLKTELEKTQERSFRRVRELKEQCELEQKAKAHLENSLRVDLDEKQITINTLKEKINFIQGNSNQNTEFEHLSKNFNELKQETENLNGINQEIKAKLIVLQSKESEYKEKIKRLLEDNEKLRDDERENNLRLAESKMQVHNELISKEAELNSLRHENDNLKKSLDQLEIKSGGKTKIEQLQNQNQNLIEKLENLSQKCQNLSNEMLKIEQYKMEIQNLKTKISEEKNAHDEEIISLTKEAEIFKEKLLKEKQDKGDIIEKLEKLLFENEEIYKNDIKKLKLQIDNEEEVSKQQKKNYEEKIFQIREDAKRGLITIEDKIKSKYEKDFSEKEEKLKLDYENNLKKLISHDEEGNDIKIKLMKCQESLKTLTEEKEVLSKNVFEKTEKYNELEKSYIELNNDVIKEIGKSSKLEKKVQALEGMEEKILRLQANILTLQKENQELSALCEDQKKEIDKLGHDAQALNNLEKVEDELKLLKLKKQMNNSEKEHIGKFECELDQIKSERNRVVHELEILKEEYVKLSEMKNSYLEKIRKYENEIESKGNIMEESYTRGLNLNDCEKCLKEKNNMIELLKKIEEDFKITCIKLESSETETKILQTKLKETKQNYEQMLMKDQSLTKENFEMKDISENCNLKCAKDYNELLNQKENLEKLYNELNEKLKITETKLENQESERNENKIQTEKLEELQNSYGQSVHKHEKDIIKSLDSESSISEMKKELRNKEEILTHKNEELKKAQTELENYEKKFNDLKILIQELKKTDEKNLKLIEEKHTNINQLTKEIEVKIQFIKNLEENYKVLDKNQKDLEKELDKCKIDYEKKSKELLEMETRFTDIQKLYSTEKKDIMKQLNELKQVEKNYYNLLDENENLKEQISEIALLQENLKSLSNVEIEKNILLDNFKQLEIDINVLKQEKFEYSKKLANMTELQEEYNKLVLEHKEVQQDKNRVEKSRDEFENKLSSATSSHRNLEGKYKSLQEEYDKLKMTTKLEEEELKIKYLNLEKMHHKLVQENNELLQTIFSIEEEKSVLESSVEEASTKNISLKKEIELLKIEKNDLKSRILQLEGSEKELKSINLAIQKENGDLLDEISKFRAENDNYSLRNVQLEEYKKKLESMKEITEMEKKDLTDENSKLKTEMELSKIEKGDINLKILKIEASKKELESMNAIMQNEKEDLVNEISRLQEKIKKITMENQSLGGCLTELDELHSKYNSILREKEESVTNFNKLKEEIHILHQKNKEISSDYKHISEDNSKLIAELEELKLNIENYSATKIELEENEITLKKDKEELQAKLKSTIEEIDTLKHDNYELRQMKIEKVNNEVEYLDAQQNYYEMKTKHNELSIENKKLHYEIEELIKNMQNFNEESRIYENKINELERNQNELLNEKQLLKEEIDELKISPLNLNNITSNPGKASSLEVSKYENGLEGHWNPEMHQMIEKVTQLKSLDITNKATIEFYETEVQNLRIKNEKLNRRLDETLVTLNHCSELSHSTELEYLKNVLYNYMLGKEGLVLTRVIATVCKFDDAQTEEVLKREQQKQTLLAKLGLL
ncbi:hypothetical protein WA026_020500 [Henosepilachna vigintioctopunctata]|uniref:GRIP domain-containing protein n=1 Tax=Henosepilachna vigintioctopunctata TaxID=420089 RepID=A0AAW1VFI4_9CUCU